MPPPIIDDLPLSAVPMLMVQPVIAKEPISSAEAAKATLFGGLAASGWHTAGITMRLIVDSDFRPAWGVIGGRMEKVEWPRPVRPGDVLHVVSEVLEVVPSRSKPTQGMLRVQCTTRNQKDEAVQVIIPNIIVPRRPG